METGNKIPEVKVKQPLISIIVPAYNIEQHLSKCLDSILAQTYENIEIIVVDDGSKDNSGKIADEYKEKYPVKVKCIHLENGGVSRARFEGIKTSSGEWIGFVDGDDMIEPDMYERLMQNALKYNADISHCGYQTIVNDGERIHYFYNTGRFVQQDRITGLKDLLSGSFIEPGLCNKLFRKTLFHSLLHENMMDFSIKINEDLMMNYILFSKSQKSVYEDFCPYLYMARSSSATRSKFNMNKVFDPLKVHKWILDNCEPELKELAWSKYIVCCFGAYSSLFSIKEMKEEARNLKREIKSNKDKWHLLGRKEKLKLKMLLTTPRLYKFIYRVYEKYFQRKVYE